MFFFTNYMRHYISTIYKFLYKYISSRVDRASTGGHEFCVCVCFFLIRLSNESITINYYVKQRAIASVVEWNESVRARDHLLLFGLFIYLFSLLFTYSQRNTRRALRKK